MHFPMSNVLSQLFAYSKGEFTLFDVNYDVSQITHYLCYFWSKICVCVMFLRFSISEMKMKMINRCVLLMVGREEEEVKHRVREIHLLEL